MRLSIFCIAAVILCLLVLLAVQKRYSVLYVDTFTVQADRYPPEITELPDLSQLQWPGEPVADTPAGVRLSERGKITALPRPFEPVMSLAQRQLSRNLLRIFSKMMFDHGFGNKFVLYGGTLIGSYRHHDFIPWDDDVDVIVDVNIRPKVQALLRTLGPNYQVASLKVMDKLYTKTSPDLDVDTIDVMISRRTISNSWGWPFLDICYYSQNSTHVSDIVQFNGRVYHWPKKVFFPLRLRPFGHEWYPAPFLPAEVIRITYGDIMLCDKFSYSHVIRRNGPQSLKNCKDLRARYAFVERNVLEKSDQRLIQSEKLTEKFVLGEERLVIHDANGRKQVIHSLVIPMLKSECRHLRQNGVN